MRDIIDSLVFDFDLLIQREVVLDIHLYLMAPPGHEPRRHRAGGLVPDGHRPVPAVPDRATAAGRDGGDQLDGRGGPAGRRGRPDDDRPADGGHRPRLAATLYGLEILVEDVEDHPDNQTRFVVAGPDRASRPPPATTGRASSASRAPTTRAACYGILGQFAARNINLTKLESRPTKQALGDYCFIIDFEGHVADEVVGRLPARPPRRAGRVKFLGSYPAAGPAGRPSGARPTTSRREADAWVDGLRARDRSRRTSLSDGARRLPVRAAATLASVRRDGRADECAALEKP